MTLTHPTLKLTLAAALVAGVSAPTLAVENDLSPLWFSADIGAATNLTQDDYQDQADDAGFDEVTVSASDTARLTWRLGAGWDFWRRPDSPFTFATQLEWFHLGDVDLSYSGSVPNSELEAMYDELESIHPESGNGLAWGLSGRWQGFNQGRLQRLGLGAELGATYWLQRYELDDVNGDTARTDNTEGAGWYGGLLADYQLTPQLTTRASWRVYGLDSETVQTATLGLTYRFKAWQKTPEPEPIVEEPAPEPMPQPEPVPVGKADQYTLEQDSSQALNLLDNDTIPTGQSVGISWVEGATAGQLRVNPGRQSVQYTHLGGNETQDSFRYWLNNGATEVGPFDVSITLTPVTPTPQDDRFQVGFNTISRLDVLSNDSDPSGRTLTVSRISQPEAGRVDQAEGILLYNHNGQTTEDLSFDYWVSNGIREVGPVRVSLTVLPEVLTIPVTFAPSSTEIRNEDQTALNKLANWLTEHPDARITVTGHTDNDGDPAFNQQLSEQRAEAVVDYLAGKGIDRDRLTAEGYGDSQPVADNGTPAGRTQNRRVEVRLN